jgi:hypothetical protein
MEYEVDRASLGLAPNTGFNFVVATFGPKTDTAPDIRTYNYQRVLGTPPPPSGQTLVPHTSSRSPPAAFTASAQRSAIGC